MVGGGILSRFLLRRRREERRKKRAEKKTISVRVYPERERGKNGMRFLLPS